MRVDRYLGQQAFAHMTRTVEALIEHLPALVQPDGSLLSAEDSHVVYYEVVLMMRDEAGPGRVFPPELVEVRRNIFKSLLETLP